MTRAPSAVSTGMGYSPGEVEKPALGERRRR
jgi:hypothetical protein